MKQYFMLNKLFLQVLRLSILLALVSEPIRILRCSRICLYFVVLYYVYWDRGTSFGVVIRLRYGQPRKLHSIAGTGNGFFCSPGVHTDTWARPATYSMGTWSTFSADKAVAIGTSNSPPFRAEDKNDWSNTSNNTYASERIHREH
jgi:hypothetical protein